MSKPKMIVVACVVVCGFLVFMANSVSNVNVNDVQDMSSINNKKRIKTSSDIALYKEGVFKVDVDENSTESSSGGNGGGSKPYDPSSHVPAGRADTPSMTQEDMNLAKLSENDAFTKLTGGEFTSYPRDNFNSIKSRLEDVYAKNQKSITVPIWKFKSGDINNLEKESSSITFICNSHLADNLTHIFTDIYNNQSKPVINPSRFGCWSIRAKVSGSTASAHAYGAALDINHDSNVTVSGGRYGNGYGANILTNEQWAALPENQTKYLVFYPSHPIVQIFKAYGWYWGGDWRSTKDGMHFGFIGDGGQRAVGLQNYTAAGGK